MLQKDDVLNLVFSFIFMCLLLTCGDVWAVSLGDVADNVLGPTGGLTHIMFMICYIAGTGFLIGSLIQYKAHRDNPTQVRLTTPAFMFVIGLVLVFLPYITRVSQSGQAAAGY